ncbi:hypothetical protein U1Q18_027599 [Sarracenia purpurea var. burkii]
MASLLGHRDMTWYLYAMAEEEIIIEEDRISLLIAAITANLFDVAWDIIQKHPEFATALAHRQYKISNLIYEIGALKDLIAAYKDVNNVNMLHLAGKLAPKNRLKIDFEVALQM